MKCPNILRFSMYWKMYVFMNVHYKGFNLKHFHVFELDIETFFATLFCTSLQVIKVFYIGLQIHSGERVGIIMDTIIWISHFFTRKNRKLQIFSWIKTGCSLVDFDVIIGIYNITKLWKYLKKLQKNNLQYFSFLI